MTLAIHVNSDDLRVRRTRMNLQKALMELMKERDFNAVTVRDITERAMVNRATFYDHFVDKYALLDSAIRDWFSQTLHEKTGGDTAPSRENMIALITVACEFLRDLRDHCRPRMGEMLPMLQTQITTVITEVMSQGTCSQASSIEYPERLLKATMTSWSIYGAALYWSQQTRPEPLGAFVARVLPKVMYGLLGAEQA